MRKILLLCLAAFIFLSGCSKTSQAIKQTPRIKECDKMYMRINQHIFEVHLYDNPTVQALKTYLPMSVTMKDLHQNEKYHYFNQSLPTQIEDIDYIHTGELMLFETNCLVLFYDDFSTNYAYTKIGYIENNDEIKNILGEGQVEVEFLLDD